MFSPSKRCARRSISCSGVLVLLTFGHVVADDPPPRPFESPATAELTDDADSRKLVKGVITLLEEQHLRGARVDNEMTRRMLDQLFLHLDGTRGYLLKEDVEQLTSRVTQIHDDLHAGNLTWANGLFATYQQRCEECVGYAAEALDQEQDFSADETLEIRDSRSEWFTSAEQQRAFWRRFAKHGVLHRMVHRGVDQTEAREMMRRGNQSFLRTVQSVDAVDMQGKVLKALTLAFDPHSNFMTRRELDDFAINMRREVAGIGMGTQLVDGALEVTRLVKNGPAHKNGKIDVGDRIVAIGQGVSGEWTDVSEFTLREAVDLMRGEPGTTLRLRVRKLGRSKQDEIRIVRDIVDLSADAVRSYLLSEVASDGSESKVGYIAMPVFYSRRLLSTTGNDAEFRECEQDVAEELASLKKRGAEVVVLDFSGNQGGGLRNAVEIPGLFIGKNVVVQTRRRGSEAAPFAPQRTTHAWDGPLVVVLDRRCAGGPEIAAAALRDYNRAVIVGGRSTHGMGTAADLYDPIRPNEARGQFKNLAGAVRITTQGYYRPTGRTTQFIGVDSDISIPSVYDETRIGEDTMDNVIELQSIEPARFQRLHFVTDDLIRTLNRSADQRRLESDEFAEYREAIDAYHELTTLEQRPLEESAFREHQEKRKSLTTKLISETEEGRLQRSPFTNEAIAIAADYAAYAREHADYFNGPKLLAGGKVDEALAVFDRLLAANPGDTDTHRRRAQALAFLGKWDDALQAAEAAGEDSLRAYTTGDTKLSAEGADDQTIAGRRRCKVTHVNGEWIYIVDRDKPEIEGWAKPKTIRPLLDGQ